jgi:hypothetical protein
MTRTISSIPRVLPLAITGLLGAGCSASADIPEVVVTQSDVRFDATPAVPGLPDQEAEIENSFDHPKGFGLPAYFDTELYPLSAVITGRGNMTDLSFVSGITLTLASRAEDALPAKVVATYERTGSARPGRAIRLRTESDADVLAYWGTQSAYYDIKLWGELPEEAWAVDVQVVFSGNVSVASD